jgi:hypothetical protein
MQAAKFKLSKYCHVLVSLCVCVTLTEIDITTSTFYLHYQLTDITSFTGRMTLSIDTIV